MRERIPPRKKAVKPRFRSAGEERREQARIEAARAQRVYLEGLDQTRLRAIGQTGKKARAFQSTVYDALGLDKKAGFNGAPPAFITDKEVNSASQVVGSGFKNAVRDPFLRLYRRRAIDEGQYLAAGRFMALLERLESVGARGIEYGERVDGGRQANVPLAAMEAVHAVRSFEKFMGRYRFNLLRAICVERLPVYKVAASYGISQRTCMDRFRAALDRAALFFN